MSDVSRDHERWLPIAGHEGFYEVSDLGLVRSVPRRIIRSNGSQMTLPGVTLTPFDSGDGHVRVRLQRIGKIVDWYVHRLVLFTFVGEPPPGTEGCHWDGHPANNALSNLRWGTRSENMLDIARLGRHRLALRTHCPRGHELVAPNLVPSEVAKGRRSCLACARARSNKSRATERGEEFDLVEAADRHHRIILGVEPPPRRDHCLRGHELVSENVVPNKDDVRRCRACRKGILRAKESGYQLSIKEASDRCYEEIVAAIPSPRENSDVSVRRSP